MNKKQREAIAKEAAKNIKTGQDRNDFRAMLTNITDAVLERVIEWQSRPLDALYPIVYLDCIVVKVRQDKHVINKSIHLAPGINMDGHKELPGMWFTENKGAKFWLNAERLQNRHRRFKTNIPIRHRRRSVAGAGSVCNTLGCTLSANQQKRAPTLA